MGSVYLIYDGNFDKPELLSVDYNFFGQSRPGDYVRIEECNYKISGKYYDPQEMDLYIDITSCVKFDSSKSTTTKGARVFKIM